MMNAIVKARMVLSSYSQKTKTKAYQEAKADETFQRELSHLLKTFVGRPTPLTHAKRLSDQLGGAQIYLKREDLAHSGAHKINNALGQALLAKRMNKKRIIAETGAGQHGVATATVCALLGLRVCRLHGNSGHGAATTECVPHEVARRRSAWRGKWNKNFKRMLSTKPSAIG